MIQFKVYSQNIQYFVLPFNWGFSFRFKGFIYTVSEETVCVLSRGVVYVRRRRFFWFLILMKIIFILEKILRNVGSIRN